MVTARQIQQLTRQRLEGTVPSYPEQWLEGPMVRRERRIMNRGGILYGRRAKTLPRLKPGGSAEAAPAKKKPTDADARLADFAARAARSADKAAMCEAILAFALRRRAFSRRTRSCASRSSRASRSTARRSS